MCVAGRARSHPDQQDLLCSALLSQLLCSSWCHLNLVPAGLSGVDKTYPPFAGVLPKKKEKRGCCYEDGLSSWWHRFPFCWSHSGVLTQLRQLIFNKRGSQLPLMILHLSAQLCNRADRLRHARTQLLMHTNVIISSGSYTVRAETRFKAYSTQLMSKKKMFIWLHHLQRNHLDGGLCLQ